MMAQTKQAKHTPLPWTFRPSYHEGEPQGYVIQAGRKVVADLSCSPEDLSIEECNAAFIIKAVNSHQELLGALQNVVYLLKAHADKSWNIDDAVAEAEKAIAHATGE